MDPIELFSMWYEEAQTNEINDPNAMSLATSTLDGRPSVRMVLLKEFSKHGFIFYTNLNSRKGRELRDNNNCALGFHWKSLRKQVRIEGTVEQVEEGIADKYFESREYLSQVGAWASMQSEPMQNVFSLQNEVAKIMTRYPTGDVPRPPFWSGFNITPHCMEFWSDGKYRLHQRFLYRLEDGKWNRTRLFP